jgi:hypothetical protein
MLAYVKPLLRMVILFAFVLTAVLLVKPTPASAYQDCCQTCDNRYSACLSACTTNICRNSCRIQLGKCIEVCPACQF